MIDLGTLLGICPVGPCDCVLLCASCTSYGSPLDQTGKKKAMSCGSGHCFQDHQETEVDVGQ